MYFKNVITKCNNLIIIKNSNNNQQQLNINEMVNKFNEYIQDINILYIELNYDINIADK